MPINVALSSIYNIISLFLFYRGSRGAYAFIILQSCHKTSSIFYVIITQSLPNQLSICAAAAGPNTSRVSDSRLRADDGVGSSCLDQKKAEAGGRVRNQGRHN
jgi:hypothetical protein